MRTGRGGSRGGWRSAVALVAAYLLVVQALLTAGMLGAHAAPAVDAYGTVICASGHAAPASDGSGDPAHLANCCVLGCATAAAALPPPAAAEVAAPATPKLGPAVVWTTSERVAGSDERTPRNTRAPPTSL